MRNLMTPSTRASRKIFFARFDATGDLALLRHPKVVAGGMMLLLLLKIAEDCGCCNAAASPLIL